MIKVLEPTKQELEIMEKKNVSRETFLKFQTYLDLLQKWNPHINLVSNDSIKDAWSRHIIDSLQIYGQISNPHNKEIADLGSGGGFPGLVLAISAVKKIYLIESDGRKCSFLREVARKLDLFHVEVVNKRIEDIELKIDVVTVRALADLSTLISYAKPLLKENGECFFLKGDRWEQELTVARKLWQFNCRSYPSISGSTGMILHIDGIQNA